MTSKIRLLGIAPYHHMKNLLLALSEEYEEVEMTVFVGDLQQGVELAKKNFYNDYDAVISRGGTAALLREQLDLPVVEIPILPFDIMRAMNLIGSVSDHYAIVGFPNVTASAELLCRLMNCRIDIYTIQGADEVESTLEAVRESGIHAILCDMVAHTVALQMGLEVVLITSGADGIHQALAEAVRMYRNYDRLWEENRFLRTLIWNQIDHTVVFNEKGELFFSTQENNESPIVEFLQEESVLEQPDERKHILKQINNMRYSIRMCRESYAGKDYIAWYFSETRVPSPDIQKGIRYEGAREAQEQYDGCLYGVVGLLRDQQEKIKRMNLTGYPVMVCGEDGTLKRQAVNYMYLNGPWKNRPLIIIDCFMLNEKSWNWLMDHHNSPLVQSDCTIFTKNVDVLSPQQRHQLIANMSAMDIGRRNRLIFSCVCKKDELVTEAGLAFVEGLSCQTLYLPPVRQRADHIPAIANMYLSYLNTSLARPVAGLLPEAMELLRNFEWPYNYTQFQRVLKELALMAEADCITEEETETVLKRERTVATLNAKAEDMGKPLDLSRTLDEINREIIQRILEEEDGNQSRTAMRLGISRTTLWRFLNQ